MFSMRKGIDHLPIHILSHLKQWSIFTFSTIYIIEGQRNTAFTENAYSSGSDKNSYK